MMMTGGYSIRNKQRRLKPGLERNETCIVGGDFLQQQQQQQQHHFDDDENKSIDSFTVDSILPDHSKSPTFNKSGRDSDANGPQVPVIAQAETKAVLWGKLVVLTVLLLSALAMALAIYYYTSHAEHAAFVQRFHQDANKIMEAIGSTLDITLGSMDAFLMVMSSYAHASNMTWPFVTLPDYYVRTAKMRSLSKSIYCVQYHFITPEQRPEWEAYSSHNDGWVLESVAAQTRDPTFHGAIIEEFNQSRIYVDDVLEKPLVPGEGYLPNWQSAPVIPYSAPYNWDGYSYQALKDALPELFNLQVILGVITNPKPNPNDPDQVANFEGITAWVKDYVREGDDPTEPFSDIHYPIVSNAYQDVYLRNSNNNNNDGNNTNGTADEERSSNNNNNVVGIFSLTFFWRQLITNILSDGSQGIIGVIGNDCGQMFTYRIDGPDATYLGDGDLHDHQYDDLETFSYFADLQNFQTGQESYTGLPLSSSHCPYWIRAYPSRRTEQQHQTRNPILFMVCTILIFLFTSLVFIIYDVCVERRQRKVMTKAIHSTAIVSSLFPSNVRDRLFPSMLEGEGGISPTRSRNKYIMEHGTEDPSSIPTSARPIADLFPDATVMFADIAGFTAWSSVREPGQVFVLLETIYGAFDHIAKRRTVFKVETIGDCYVAVVGLPDPCPNHAVVMVKFARDCRDKFNHLVRSLEVTLGPDTGDLQMRFGLNSGAVTAGVLRGEKGRFQLFGDTVNTAARMESNGIRNRIHVSEATANLLKTAGKEHWVTARDDIIEAKGKGQMQTYWVEPSSTSFHDSSKTASDPTVMDTTLENIAGEIKFNDKIERLVDWHVEIFSKLIRQIIAQRNYSTDENVIPADTSFCTTTKNSIEGSTVLDEVTEVIEFPQSDADRYSRQSDTGSVDLDDEVLTQLRDYVRNIAAAYHNNNPFHNFEHASHVTMSAAKLLSRIVENADGVQRRSSLSGHHHHDHHHWEIQLDPLTQLACVFSALIHDVDHQGVPNSQLVKENAYIASVYKNRSVAEQNSVDIAWNLFMDERFDALRNVICHTPAELARFRQLVVNSVMATDIMDRDLKASRDTRWQKAFQEGLVMPSHENSNRKATIVIEHLIQASDIAHTMQHWHVYCKWNERLFEEMYLAYKRGRSEKDPSEFWYQAEIGFFDFYVIPLAKKLRDCGVFGVSSHEYLEYANKNRAEWESRGKEAVSFMVERVRHKVAQNKLAAI